MQQRASLMPARGSCPRLAPSAGARNLRVAAPPPAAFVVGGAAASSLVAAPGAILSAATILGGLVMLQREMSSTHQEDSQQSEAISQRPCPNCGGSGVQACHCHKWSDGDAGCNTCNHTGHMRCQACGGGGRAVPLKATVRR